MTPLSPIIQLCEELATAVTVAGIPTTRDLCPDIKFESIEALTGVITPYDINTRRHTRADERYNELKLLVFIVSPAKKRELPELITRVDSIVSILLGEDLPSAKITGIELDPLDNEMFSQESIFKATLIVTLTYITDRT